MHSYTALLYPTLASLLHLCGWCLLVWAVCSGTPLFLDQPPVAPFHIICIPGTMVLWLLQLDADTPALPVPAQRAPACLGCDV